MPARHLIDTDRYTTPMSVSRRITTMMSSRGCPGKCVFCDRPQMGRKFRKRSAQSVVDEMAYCVNELGISEIKFYDDTFTIDKKRVLEICDLLIEKGLKVVWEIRARVDTMTPEMITRLRQAGCCRIHYGVETGSPRLQKLLRKNLDLQKVSEIFKLTCDAGIETLGYFMIGLPEETGIEMQQTVEMIGSIPMDYVHIGIFTPYPGTDIYRQAIDNGFYEKDYWKEFAADPKPGFTPMYWNEHFSDDELFRKMKKLYAGFYSRPGYIIKRLMKIRSLDELIRKAGLGIKLIKEVSFN